MKTPPISPISRAYWVISGKLLAGPYPGSLDAQEASQKLRALVDCGIRRVINLMQAGEVNAQGLPFAPYIEIMRAFAAETGEPVEWSRHPIRDMSVPSREVMRAILDEIDRSTAAGQPVYLHCWGGVGRTGTTVGCFLARHNIATGDAAIERIALLRQHILPYRDSPETEDQRDFIRAWRPGE